MNNNKKKISIVSCCYNEEGNLQEFYDRITKVMSQLSYYSYEIIIIDNYSIDNSRNILRKIAAKDEKFKVIFNSRNFGQIRSPYNAILQATGDVVIGMVSDLQDPPELIIDLVHEWERGAKVVCAVKPQSKENVIMSMMRRFYYWLVNKFSETVLINNFNGFGLYDRKFIEALKKFHDPYPYFRGLVSEIGFKRVEVPFVQDKRKFGKSKNNIFSLLDFAMTGFVNHSKLPLRLATFFGFCLALVSFFVALIYFIYKLLFWDTFSLGLAPIVIGLFFLFAMQLIFIGIIGEYVGAILTQVKNYPLVIEEERINFD
jgi:glycosyltransferase involved in cell wall biosynthesis